MALQVFDVIKVMFFGYLDVLTEISNKIVLHSSLVMSGIVILIFERPVKAQFTYQLVSSTF